MLKVKSKQDCKINTDRNTIRETMICYKYKRLHLKGYFITLSRNSAH